MCPSPILLESGIVRVFFTSLDSDGRGHVCRVDLDPAAELHPVELAMEPVLGPGVPGAFDVDGVMATSVVTLGNGTMRMYYSGFERCASVRYRVFAGMAESDDDGNSWMRVSQAPILDRSDEGLLFRAGPYVDESLDGFRMVYLAGSGWTSVRGRQLPIYDPRSLESRDGLTWPSTGHQVLELTDPAEKLAASVVSVPCHPWMTDSEVSWVVDCLSAWRSRNSS